MSGGAQVDDAGTTGFGATGFEAWEQEICEKKWCDVVYGPGP